MEVHRLRIGNYLPKPIKAIAVDHIYSQKIAVGREDGAIEILDPRSNYSVQARIGGAEDFKLQALQWSVHNEEVRLFGISLKGFLFEADLEHLSVANVEDVYGGAAWCLAASPREPLLAVGGEKGLVRLFRYHSLRRLDYEKSIATSSSRILSIAYHPNTARMFVGGNDGTIRCIDEVSEQTLFRMIGDVAPNPKASLPLSASACIWSLAVSDDSTVVSGDSAGLVQVWDGETGVLQQSLTHHHLGDVLTVALRSDGRAFFTAGVDGKVNCFQRSSGDTAGLWHLSQSHRLHSHDVFSLALCPHYHTPVRRKNHVQGQALPDGKRRRLQGGDEGATVEGDIGAIDEQGFTEGEYAPVLDHDHDSESEVLVMSGGLDSRLCFYSADRFDSFKPFFLPLVRNRHDHHLLQVVAKGIRGADKELQAVTCVMKRHETVDVWRISSDDKDNNKEGEEDKADAERGGDVSRRCELLLRLQPRGDQSGSNQVELAVTSPSGRLLLLAGRGFLKLLQLHSSNPAITPSPTPREVPLPSQLLHLSGRASHGHVTAAVFDEDESHVTLWDSTSLHLLRLRLRLKSKGAVEVEVEVEHDVTLNPNGGGAGEEGMGIGRSPADRKLNKQVKRLYVSDGEEAKYVAVQTCADVIHIYQSAGLIRRWTLPSTSSALVADVCFYSERFLFLLLTDDRLLTYDVESLQLLDEQDLQEVEAETEAATSNTASTSRRAKSTLQRREISTYCGLTVQSSSSSSSSSTAVTMVCYSPMHCLVLQISLTSAANSSKSSDHSTSKSSQKKKRKAVADESMDGVRGEVEVEVKGVAVSDRYRNILSMTLLPYNHHDHPITNNKSQSRPAATQLQPLQHQLVVVENPWTNLQDQLPDVVQRKRYGT